MGTDCHSEGALREIVAGLPTKRDLQDMTASIVNALSRELELESSTTSVDARPSTLETEHQSFRRHLIKVHLRLDDGENCSR